MRKIVLKRALLTVALAIATVVVFAQEEKEEEQKEKGFQKEKLFVGGNFGLSFGSYTLINVSPQIGYRFTNFFAAGVGINLQHVGWKDEYSDGTTIKTSKTVMGLNVFGRAYPIKTFMIQIQPEANYIFGKEKYQAPNQAALENNIDTHIVPSLLLGGGLVIPSGRGAFITSVFYDVLQDANSPYGNRPIVNFTYNIGL